MKVVMSLLAALCISIIAWGVWFGTTQENVNNNFNQWLDACMENGGIAVLVEKASPNGFTGDRYGCFVKGEQIEVPGYR